MLSVCHLLTVSVWRVPSVAPHALLQHYYVILCYLYSGLLGRALFLIDGFAQFSLPSSSLFPPLPAPAAPKRTGFPAPWASKLHVTLPPPPGALNSHLEVESRSAVFYASAPQHAPLSFPCHSDLTWPDPSHSVSACSPLWPMTSSWPHLVTHLHRFS